MSVSVRLRGKLPDGNANGLLFLGRDLLADPGTRILVALVAPVSVTENLESGNETVTLGLDAVELTDSTEAREFLRRLTVDRTGEAELPFDTPPAGVDPTTGEIVDYVADELGKAAAAAGLDVTIERAPRKTTPAKTRKATK